MKIVKISRGLCRISPSDNDGVYQALLLPFCFRLTPHCCRDSCSIVYHHFVVSFTRILPVAGLPIDLPIKRRAIIYCLRKLRVRGV